MPFLVRSEPVKRPTDKTFINQSGAHHLGMDADSPDLMTPQEVASAFGVSNKTVRLWAESGRLESLRTPRGHRRFVRGQVERLLRAQSD
jgi:excisionase family DNA binding protein